jgi:hypothetical protein
VRGRTACELPLPGGVLLGMDPDATYEEATQSLEPGDTLLLFTDGLIEQRGESIVDVLREFVATVAPVPAGQEGRKPTGSSPPRSPTPTTTPAWSRCASADMRSARLCRCRAVP